MLYIKFSQSSSLKCPLYNQGVKSVLEWTGDVFIIERKYWLLMMDTPQRNLSPSHHEVTCIRNQISNFIVKLKIWRYVQNYKRNTIFQALYSKENIPWQHYNRVPYAPISTGDSNWMYKETTSLLKRKRFSPVPHFDKTQKVLKFMLKGSLRYTHS